MLVEEEKTEPIVHKAVIFILCLSPWLRDRDQYYNGDVLKSYNVQCHYVGSVDDLENHGAFEVKDDNTQFYLIVDESDILIMG